jgi:hypothetical protein
VAEGSFTPQEIWVVVKGKIPKKSPKIKTFATVGDLTGGVYMRYNKSMMKTKPVPRVEVEVYEGAYVVALVGEYEMGLPPKGKAYWWRTWGETGSMPENLREALVKVGECLKEAFAQFPVNAGYKGLSLHWVGEAPETLRVTWLRKGDSGEWVGALPQEHQEKMVKACGELGELVKKMDAEGVIG